jgi:uncharacterized protein YjbK
VGLHEKNISYFVYLWSKGLIEKTVEGHLLDDSIKGFDWTDYELTFEVEPGNEGGTNLLITYDYYYFDDLMKIV